MEVNIDKALTIAIDRAKADLRIAREKFNEVWFDLEYEFLKNEAMETTSNLEEMLSMSIEEHQKGIADLENIKGSLIDLQTAVRANPRLKQDLQQRLEGFLG